MAGQPTAAYNFTIDDASPLIKYEPTDGWDDNVTQDVNLPNYFQESYHYSINATATASLTFTGTGAWAFGGRRSVNGAYSIQIDDLPAQTFEATPDNFVQYQAVLGGQRGLPFGEHTITVTNLSNDPKKFVLDIDAFLVETAVGNGADDTYNGPILVDDAATKDSGIVYSNNWASTSAVAPPGANFLGGTAHETRVNGASVQFTFEGQGLGVMGAVGPRNGNFRVEVDGQNMGEMSAKAAAFHASTPIWYASNLTPGQHTVTLTNTGSNSDALTIDSYQVFQAAAAAPNPVTTGSSAPNTTPTVGEGNVTVSKSPSLPLGAIIGGIVGGLIFLGLIIFGVLLYLRLRRKNATLNPAISSFNQPPPTDMLQVPSSGSVSRVDSRSSAATAVDIEAGFAAAAEKGSDKAEKSTGWLGTIRRPSTKDKDEPSTPPLPLQNYMPSPATPNPAGPNPILGTGGYVPSGSGAYLAPVPSVPMSMPMPMAQQAPPPTIAMPVPPIPVPVVAVSAPRTPPAHSAPTTPLPPPPLVLGMPPRGRQQGPKNGQHGRAPSLGAGSAGPSRSRSLTSHEIRRSRSAQAMKAQGIAQDNDALPLPPPPSRFQDYAAARESHQSLGFDLSAYTDPQTPVEDKRVVPAVPSIPREYAPYATGSSSARSSLDSQRSGGAAAGGNGAHRARRPGMF